MESHNEPLVGLLGAMGVTQTEILGTLTAGACEKLLQLIPSLPSAPLQALALESFKYIEQPELRPIVLAVLEAQQDCPPELVDELVGPRRSLLAAMPINVKHRVWESNKESFLAETHPFILDRIEQVEAERHELLSLFPSDPAKRRKGSASTLKLVELVGSQKLYVDLIDLLRDIFANAGSHEERGQIALLRCDVAMALHDMNDARRPVTRWETEHRSVSRPHPADNGAPLNRFCHHSVTPYPSAVQVHMLPRCCHSTALCGQAAAADTDPALACSGDATHKVSLA